MLRTASSGRAEAGKLHTSKPISGLGGLRGIARLLRVNFRQRHLIRLWLAMEGCVWPISVRERGDLWQLINRGGL